MHSPVFELLNSDTGHKNIDTELAYACVDRLCSGKLEISMDLSRESSRRRGLENTCYNIIHVGTALLSSISLNVSLFEPQP
eukprot:COSAG02_NODE_3935_length_6022_cov_102.607294_4_plen_81_part_00